MSFPGDDGYPGFKDTTDGLASLNVIAFVVQQILAGVATAALVQVKGVVPSGIGPNVGRVSVQPMVSQIGGTGIAVAHGTIFDVPYFRFQGGVSAVALDPAVGDIGLAVFASRDISAVKATRQVSPPGSRRRFDWADGLYFGGFLNGTPQNYVEFEASGQINVHSTTKLTLDANGTGFVIDGGSGTITTYSNHSGSFPSNPPQVPT